jgi:F420-non-reducing hydrogenase iron-sulfur subunit
VRLFGSSLRAWNKEKKMSYEPKIIGFTCNWCTYAAADLAGVSRMQYPPNIRLVRVMCSGMVHPKLVVDAFMLGADGVMVMGWHLGECHYLDGNHKAQARSPVIAEMVDSLGLESERFQLVWCSSAEADRFVQAVTQMTQKLVELGPSPFNNHAQQVAAS